MSTAGLGQLGPEFGQALPSLAIKSAICQGRPYGAAWLGVVPAIPEPAIDRQNLDLRLEVGEGCGKPCLGVPETQLTHARRVQQQGA